MPTSQYRQLINRDLPPYDRASTSKALYVSRGEANTFARRGRGQDGSVRPYRCAYCGSWHLGHRRSRRSGGH